MESALYNPGQDRPKIGLGHSVWQVNNAEIFFIILLLNNIIAESFSISFVTVNKLSRKLGLKVSKPQAKAKDIFSFFSPNFHHINGNFSPSSIKLDHYVFIRPLCFFLRLSLHPESSLVADVQPSAG